MTTYLIVYGEDSSDRLAAYAFGDRKRAIAAAATCIVPAVPPDGTPGVGGCALVVEKETDVTLSKTAMAAISRGLAGSGPVHVSDRAMGIKQLFEVLAKHAHPVALPDDAPMPTMTDRLAHEAWLRDHAEAFIACAFVGVPKVYEKSQAKSTLVEAIEQAKLLYRDRPVAIYAIYGARQAHVGNYDPIKGGFTVEEVKANRRRRNKEAVVETRQPRSTTVTGQFKPVRPGSSLARIIESAARGNRTIADIAQEAGLREDQAIHRLRYVLRVNHGVEHDKDEAGVVTLHLPAGRSIDDLIPTKASEVELEQA